MIKARIFGVCRHRLATDGEGITTLVAFSGCPLRCKYCINKESWDDAASKEYTPESLYEAVKIDHLYFLATHGGVTFGGGEPMLQVGFISEFRKLCGLQWNLTLETSLNVPHENVVALNDVVNNFIIDIKDCNALIYKNYTGIENAVVIENLQWLLQNSNPERIMVRVPHIPQYNTDENVQKSIALLQAMGVQHVDEFEYVIRV